MAKNHYSFKKRQKELNRLKKKEDKRQRKLQKTAVETDAMENPASDEAGNEKTGTASMDAPGDE